ncbi:hypothetical protein GCM10010231_56810 [Streptomyces sindenensis]|nr:hypothetical protein GCM10010231_56810 [Streptomyces sindenensis]
MLKFGCRVCGGIGCPGTIRLRDNSENFTDPPGVCQPSPDELRRAPARPSVQVSEPAARVRLGVLDPAQ